MQHFQNVAKKKNIIILGAGFAGITAALELSKKLARLSLEREYSVILINEMPHHLFTPCLYEIASIQKSDASAVDLKSIACIPIEDIITNTPILFLEERATRINRFSKTIYFSDDRALDYEYLIVAAGSEMTSFGIPGIFEYAHFLKKFNDAIILRNKTEDLVKIKREVRIIVAGGGPTGVELIAEFYNFICSLQKKNSAAPRCDVHLELIEAAETILNGFPKTTIKLIIERLRSYGINIRTHAPIIKISDHEAFLEDGSRIHYDLFVWGGGVTGSSILKTLGVPLTKKGNVPVNAFLQISDDPSVFVVGDNAAFIHPQTNGPLPWSVPVAELEGRLAAKNVIRMILQKSLIPFKPRARYPYILTVGRKFAVADLIILRFSGTFAWIVKQLIELRYLTAILPYSKALSIWFRALRYFHSND